MNKTGKIFVLAVVAGGLILSSGCSTISDWFGWGDDEETQEPIGGAAAPSPVDGLTPGKWSAPGGTLPSRAEWKAIPGMTFPTVYFAYDQSAIGTSEQSKLEQVANYLIQHTDVNLIIEGHCDERGSLEYNRALGERRALSVRDFLSRMGIADTRMQTISYGEEKPADPGQNETAYAKNRRAELVPAK